MLKKLYTEGRFLMYPFSEEATESHTSQKRE